MAEEDFDVVSLAKFLHLTPDQVRRMADRDKLPGRRIGGEWRFSRAEIHHWFEDRIGISDEQELVEVERVLEQQPKIVDAATDGIEHLSDLLPLQNMAIPLVARTKRSVISNLCKFAGELGLLWDPPKMEEAIFKREELHPTALENGVALLHPRRPQTGIIGDPFLCLGVTSSGIPFGGPRGSLTDVFFLIASVNEQQHLKVLARLSRIIRIPNLLMGLRDAGGSAEAYRLLMDADSGLT